MDGFYGSRSKDKPRTSYIYDTYETHIDKVEVDNVTLKISFEPVTNARKPTTLTIDQIMVKDIGKKQNGVPLDEVTSILIRSIIGSAAKAAPEQIPSILLSTMEGGLSSLTHCDIGGVHIDLGEGLSKVIDGIGDATKGGANATEKAVEGIGKGIGDLIGGDKKTSQSSK